LNGQKCIYHPDDCSSPLHGPRGHRLPPFVQSLPCPKLKKEVNRRIAICITDKQAKKVL
jgi:hypothetical protein